MTSRQAKVIWASTFEQVKKFDEMMDLENGKTQIHAEVFIGQMLTLGKRLEEMLAIAATEEENGSSR